MPHVDNFRSHHCPLVNIMDIVGVSVKVNTATVHVKVKCSRLGIRVKSRHIHGVAEIGLDFLLHALGDESYRVKSFQRFVMEVPPIIHGEVLCLFFGGGNYELHHEAFQISPHCSVLLMQLAVMFHHIPDGSRIDTFRHVVYLDQLCFLLLQCVPYGIAAVGYNFCKHNHGSLLSLVSTGDEIFSSMLYQCWMSSALDLIHQIMNFSVLKSFNFSSSVFLERTLVIFIRSVLA